MPNPADTYAADHDKILDQLIENVKLARAQLDLQMANQAMDLAAQFVNSYRINNANVSQAERAMEIAEKKTAKDVSGHSGGGIAGLD